MGRVLSNAETASLLFGVERAGCKGAGIIWTPGDAQETQRSHPEEAWVNVENRVLEQTPLSSDSNWLPKRFQIPFYICIIKTAELSPLPGKLILQCDSKGTSLHLTVCDLISRPTERGE